MSASHANGPGRGDAGTAAPRLRWQALLKAVLRESRAGRGRLLFFTLCLAIGVAAVVGVSSLVGAVESGMSSRTREMLAGDLRVRARRPLPPEVDAWFEGRPHERTEVVEMAAMVSLPDGVAPPAGRATSRLAELKSVERTYPLYGELLLDPPGLSAADLGADRAFVAPSLALELGMHVGDEIVLGGAPFEVAALVVSEPDRMEIGMNLGPRVFVGPAGLERTELLGTASRVRYAALYTAPWATDPGAIQQVEDELEAALEPDYPWIGVRTHEDAQRSVSRWSGRVDEYLGLVALLSLLLGGIGVSQIVRAWLAGRTQSVAVMRCLGFRAREVAALYLGNVALLAIAGCVLGGVIGSLLPALVRSIAPEPLADLAAVSFQTGPFLRGVGLGLFVAVLFSVPPLAAVWRVPPAAVLRAEAAPLAAPRAVRIGAPLAILAAVLISARVQAGEWDVAFAFSGGLVALAALLWLGARLASGLSGRIPRGRFGPYLENGLAALSRPGAGTTGAIVALGIGVMVVVGMWLIESRLSHALVTALPDDAPSVFLLDIQPDQWEGVQATLEDSGARALASSPVVSARLRSVDGVPVREYAELRREQGESTWPLRREQRLAWQAELPEDNEIVAGELWSMPEVDEISLELDYAEDLGVEIGAELGFEVQGVPFELVVSSLRTVDWRSFHINFFAVVEPGVLEEAPHWRLAAGRVDSLEQEVALQNDLALEHPNVTVVRVREQLEKVSGLLERLAIGIRALGAFTIVTGIVILAGAVGTTALRRAREAALLKTLGVTRRGVTLLFACEYALVGLVAGLLGAVGALALAWSFLTLQLELEVDLPWSALPLAALATAALATLSGLAASARALRARPMATLRG